MEESQHIQKVRAKARTNPIDVYLGKRLRLLRSFLGYSQLTLAQKAGMTFQQIQKYESGANRMSGTRLFDFSLILNVPVSYFYEGIEPHIVKQSPMMAKLSEEEQTEILQNFHKDNKNNPLLDEEAMQLLNFYQRIRKRTIAKDILKLMHDLATSSAAFF